MVLSIVCIVCEIIFQIQNNEWVNLILMTVPYGLIYALGMNINKFSHRQLFTLSLICGAIFAAIAVYNYLQTNQFVTTADSKYPPRIYYLTYALSITLILWIFRGYLVILSQKIHLLNFFGFIGSHTYWLYLWHIPFVDIVNTQYSYPIRFCIIFGGALSCVVIQDYIVKHYIYNRKLAAIFNG